jgi:hypothetical protein
MFMGVRNMAGDGWIQCARTTNADTFNLLLNPIGGNVGIGGNMGIGTGLPTSKMEIRAFGSASNPSASGSTLQVYNKTNSASQDACVSLRVAGASAGDPFITFDVEGQQGWSAGMDNSDGDKFKIGSYWGAMGTNTRMTITTDGNVGIGTAVPGARLDVDGDVNVKSVLYLTGGTDRNDFNIVDEANRTNTYISFGEAGTANDWAYLRQIGGNNAYHMALDFHDDGADARFSIRDIQSTNNPDTITTRFTVASGGNVGIGTASPSHRLTVKSNYQDESTGIKIDAADGNQYNLIMHSFVQGSGQVGYNFKVNNLGTTHDALILGHNGNVGIGGIIVPTATLDVNGSIKSNSSNGLEIRNTAPTITFRDTDHLTGFIHMNSNLMYFLRGASDVGYGSWSQVNGQWPFIINMNDNSVSAGGSLTAVGNVSIPTNFSYLGGQGILKARRYTIGSTYVYGQTNTRLILVARMLIRKVQPASILVLNYVLNYEVDENNVFKVYRNNVRVGSSQGSGLAGIASAAYDLDTNSTMANTTVEIIDDGVFDNTTTYTYDLYVEGTANNFFLNRTAASATADGLGGFRETAISTYGYMEISQ